MITVQSITRVHPFIRPYPIPSYPNLDWQTWVQGAWWSKKHYRAITSIFATGSRGSLNWENYRHFWDIGKNCTSFKWRKYLIFSFRFSAILTIQRSLFLWKVLNFELLWKTSFETFSWDQNVNAIGIFLRYNWENTSLFAIGSGAEFRPQFEGSDSPVLPLLMSEIWCNTRMRNDSCISWLQRETLNYDLRKKDLGDNRSFDNRTFYLLSGVQHARSSWHGKIILLTWSEDWRDND